MKFPFEVSFDEIQESIDTYISAVFACLESEFLVLPKGDGFVEYSVFETGYEAPKKMTAGFTQFSTASLLQAASETPISLLVLRTMLGFTPPEWVYIATHETGIQITQGFARSLDRKIRLEPFKALSKGEATATRVQALVETAYRILTQNVPDTEPDKIHRLDKADTREGLETVRTLAHIGVPYAMLLYERFLGRPFAGHRDSVSELIGDSLESKIEEVLSNAGISYQKTKRAERIPGFDQAPDFIIPSGFNPKIVIEAKITEDDGTARDKVTRVQHLAALSTEGQPQNHPKFEVIACIGGRGFGVRREDMRKLLYATKGKVFTAKTLDRIVDCSDLREFRTKSP